MVRVVSCGDASNLEPDHRIDKIEPPGHLGSGHDSYDKDTEMTQMVNSAEHSFKARLSSQNLAAPHISSTQFNNIRAKSCSPKHGIPLQSTDKHIYPSLSPIPLLRLPLPTICDFDQRTSRQFTEDVQRGAPTAEGRKRKHEDSNEMPLTDQTMAEAPMKGVRLKPTNTRCSKEWDNSPSSSSGKTAQSLGSKNQIDETSSAWLKYLIPSAKPVARLENLTNEGEASNLKNLASATSKSSLSAAPQSSKQIGLSDAANMSEYSQPEPLLVFNPFRNNTTCLTAPKFDSIITAIPSKLAHENKDELLPPTYKDPLKSVSDVNMVSSLKRRRSSTNELSVTSTLTLASGKSIRKTSSRTSTTTLIDTSPVTAPAFNSRSTDGNSGTHLESPLNSTLQKQPNHCIEYDAKGLLTPEDMDKGDEEVRKQKRKGASQARQQAMLEEMKDLQKRGQRMGRRWGLVAREDDGE